MKKDETVAFTRKVLSHLCGPHQVRGEGELPAWEQKLFVTQLSRKTRDILAEAGHRCTTFAMSDLRTWSPGMRLGSKFKVGAGPKDPHWIQYVPWRKFLLILADLMCRLFGIDPELGQLERYMLIWSNLLLCC